MNIKKLSTCALAGVMGLSSIAGLAFGGDASAVSLADKLTAKNLFGGNVASFTTSYNEANDVTELETTIYLNDAAISAILAQTSGEGSLLGMGYIELKPNIDANVGAWYKQNAYFSRGTDIDTEKAELKKKLAADVEKGASETKPYDTIWPIGAFVLTKNSEGKWGYVPGDGDGKTSVEQGLRTAIGKTNGEELVYGEDYKVGMYTTLEWMYAWLDASDTEAEPVYVLQTFNITYPFAGVVEPANGYASENYYKDLEALLNSDEKKVIVRESVDFDGDLVVPEGMTLEIAKDVTIALPAGKTVSGEITGEGKVTIDGEDYVAEPVEEPIDEPEPTVGLLEGAAYSDDGQVYLKFETPIEGEAKVEMKGIEYTTDELAEKSEFLKAVYDISVVNATTGEVIPVKDNKIEVRLTLDPEDYEGMKYFKVAYIDADGKIAEIFDPEVKVYADGFLTLVFTTTHLSQYGVLASETEFPATLTPDTGVFTGAEANSVNYTGLIATVAVMTIAMVAMEVVAYKKRS